MRTMPWRMIGGPLLTTLVSAITLYLHWYVISMPAPGALPFLSVMCAAYMGGTRGGLISSAIAIPASIASNALPDLTFDLVGIIRIGALSVATIGITLFIGTLRNRALRVLEIERTNRERVEATNAELMRLHAALDRVNYGIVLLDEDLNAQFLNQAYLRLFDLPAEQIKRGIQFADLLRYMRETALITLPQVDLENYITHRMDQMRARIETRADLRLRHGKVVRAQSTPLPEGGWMLSYTDVTDLVSQADEMAQLAAIDGMTELYNRRHFQKLGQEACERAQRERRPLSVLMIDIDHFKSINDRFGHAAGDDVIRCVANLCRTELRSGDVAARLGGDEFALLLPDTTAETAAALAERLRQRVAGTVLVKGEFGSVATISVGVAETASGMWSLGELMLRADTALYQAKRGDRNSVVCAGDDRLEQTVAA